MRIYKTCVWRMNTLLRSIKLDQKGRHEFVKQGKLITNQTISLIRRNTNRIFRHKLCCKLRELQVLYYLKVGGIAQSLQRLARAGQFGVRTPVGWKYFFYPHPSRPVLGHTQSPIQSVLKLFPAGKAAEAWHRTPTPSSAAVKHGRSYTSTLLSAHRLPLHQGCPSFLFFFSKTQAPP